MVSTQHSMGVGHLDRDFEPAAHTGNYMRTGTARTRCADIITPGRERSWGNANFSSGYQHVDDPEVDRVSSPLECGTSFAKGFDNHEISMRSIKYPQGHVFVLRRDILWTLTPTSWRWPFKLEFSWRRIFSLPHLPVCRRRAASDPKLEKEGTFTSTERRIQRLYEVFEPWKSPARLANHPDIANRLGAKWEYQHPSEIYRDDRFVDALCSQA